MKLPPKPSGIPGDFDTHVKLMFDLTALAWQADNSNQHDHDPLPILLAGGASGRLQGGRHIRAGKGMPMGNLLVAVLHKLGVPADSFGDSTGVLGITRASFPRVDPRSLYLTQPRAAATS